MTNFSGSSDSRTQAPTGQAADENSNMLIALFNRVITVGQAVALIAIAAAALYGVGDSILKLFSHNSIEIGMLLLIFLYLEILSMVKGSRLGTREIPIHTPIALAIVAVARYLMVDVEHIDALYIAYLSGAILILVLSLWIVRKSEKH